MDSHSSSTSGSSKSVWREGTVTVENVNQEEVEDGEELNRYMNVRSASFADFSYSPLPAHISSKSGSLEIGKDLKETEEASVLISTRFQNSSQLHHVRFPMGMRQQLTFGKEPLSSCGSLTPCGCITAEGPEALPRNTNCFVYLSDQGGDESYDLFLHHSSLSSPVRITRGQSAKDRCGNFAVDVNPASMSSHSTLDIVNAKCGGSKIYFTSTHRTGIEWDVYSLHLPACARHVDSTLCNSSREKEKKKKNNDMENGEEENMVRCDRELRAEVGELKLLVKGSGGIQWQIMDAKNGVIVLKKYWSVMRSALYILNSNAITKESGNCEEFSSSHSLIYVDGFDGLEGQSGELAEKKSEEEYDIACGSASLSWDGETLLYTCDREEEFKRLWR